MAFRLIASVDIPELGEKYKSTKGLYAAGVDSEGVSFGRAGLIVGDKDTSVVLVALSVQLSRYSSSRCRKGNVGELHYASRNGKQQRWTRERSEKLAGLTINISI